MASGMRVGSSARRVGRVRVAAAGAVLAALVLAGVAAAAGAAGGGRSTAVRLSVARRISTSPFLGSTTVAGDNEDVVYVARDDAFWIADDNANALYEVDRRTGGLLDRLDQRAFMAAPQYGGGALAPSARSEDFEALAYDSRSDLLYAFSGSTNAVPTVYRLTRGASGRFTVESWQSLPQEWNGAAWNPADRQLYVVRGATFDTFEYATARFGAPFAIAGVDKVTGITFDPGGDLLAVNARLYRVSLTTRAVRRGWKALPLKPLGIGDSRGVATVGGQIIVGDGDDTRPPADPDRHAIYVLDARGGSGHRSTGGPTARAVRSSGGDGSVAPSSGAADRTDGPDARPRGPHPPAAAHGAEQRGPDQPGPDPRKWGRGGSKVSQANGDAIEKPDPTSVKHPKDEPKPPASDPAPSGAGDGDHVAGADQPAAGDQQTGGDHVETGPGQ